MGGGGAPPPDPNMGKAALLSAETGQQMLEWSKSQADISNKWADEDRTRYQTVFQPLEDDLISEAQAYDTPDRRNQYASRASADVMTAASQQAGQRKRRATAMGVRPDAGASTETERRSATDTALAAAGAGNMARRTVEKEGEARKAAVVNMGRGLAVNPGQSLGMATNAGNAGFQGAMQGYNQQASILDRDHSNRMQAWQADQASNASLMGGIGSIAGLGLQMGWFSSEDAKENKAPARGALRAVDNMRVDSWDYKRGAGDEGHHVGPYAEEFTRETGLGDGKTIKAVDAVGVSMGAIKELSANVVNLQAQVEQRLDRLEGRERGVKRAA